MSSEDTRGKKHRLKPAIDYKDGRDLQMGTKDMNVSAILSILKVLQTKAGRKRNGRLGERGSTYKNRKLQHETNGFSVRKKKESVERELHQTGEWRIKLANRIENRLSGRRKWAVLTGAVRPEFPRKKEGGRKGRCCGDKETQ